LHGRWRGLKWRRFDAAEAKIVAEQQSFEHAGDEYTKSNANLETFMAKKEELTAKFVPLKEQSSEAQDLLAKKKEESETLQNEQRTVMTELGKEKKRAAKIREEVDEERKVLEAADGGNQARMLQEIEEEEAKLVEAQRRVTEQPSKDDLLSNQRASELKLKDVKTALGRKREELDRARSRLHDLQNEQPDIMAGYDTRIHRVLADIERDRGWRQKPVGPLGQHIQLLKPEWSSILERLFGNALGGFLVTNKPDQDRINALCKRHK
jgi:chromosome segregation ATPase